MDSRGPRRETLSAADGAGKTTRVEGGEGSTDPDPGLCGRRCGPPLPPQKLQKGAPETGGVGELPLLRPRAGGGGFSVNWAQGPGVGVRGPVSQGAACQCSFSTINFQEGGLPGALCPVQTWEVGPGRGHDPQWQR